jgi:5-methylcytosine-specific restriction enzyme subunit McrC
MFIESNGEDDPYNSIIIDTKWKAIDSTRPDKNYMIDMKDMYQLYAYGLKYRLGQSKEKGQEVIPKLVLLYPYSEKFTESLPEFIYEDFTEQQGIKLKVIPFDLSDPNSYESQVRDILNAFN